jgi:hypothetical protein
MNKREHFGEDVDKNDTDNPTKKLKRAQTLPVDDTQTPSQLEGKRIKFPEFTKMKTMSTVETIVLSDPDEKKEDVHTESSPENTEKADSEISYYSEEEGEAEVKMRKKKLKDMQNVMFYLNKIPSRPQGDHIENILKYWKTDYKKLEIHHGYIQWLFPNFYGSAFNMDAFKLMPEEATIFRENIEVADRLVRAYELILGFFGMKLVDRKTGKLARAENYEERYKATLITSLHNHLRVRRILAHLNIVGFRNYAIELVNFLETEMFGGKGAYKVFKGESRPLSNDYIRSIKTNPLFAIIRYDVFKDWKIYGECTSNEEREILYKNCFTDDEKDYAPSIILRS